MRKFFIPILVITGSVVGVRPVQAGAPDSYEFGFYPFGVCAQSSYVPTDVPLASGNGLFASLLVNGTSSPGSSTLPDIDEITGTLDEFSVTFKWNWLEVSSPPKGFKLDFAYYEAASCTAATNPFNDYPRTPRNSPPMPAGCPKFTVSTSAGIPGFAADDISFLPIVENGMSLWSLQFVFPEVVNVPYPGPAVYMTVGVDTCFGSEEDGGNDAGFDLDVDLDHYRRRATEMVEASALPDTV